MQVLFPATCLGCDSLIQGAGNICVTCREKLRFIKGGACSTCGLPLNIDYKIDDLTDYQCGDCRKTPPIYTKAAAGVRYEGVAKKILTEFKYKGQTAVAGDLAEILFSLHKDTFEGFSVDQLMHVPLFSKKLKKRGYDQAFIIANEIGKRIGVKPLFGNLQRIRDTETQTHLNREERKKNVKGAFMLNEPEKVRGKRIILVDDVYTTGATVNECATLLRGAGARSLLIVTVARV